MVTASSQGLFPLGEYTAIFGAFSKITLSIFLEGLEISSNMANASLSVNISKETPLILHSFSKRSSASKRKEPPR